MPLSLSTSSTCVGEICFCGCRCMKEFLSHVQETRGDGMAFVAIISLMMVWSYYRGVMCSVASVVSNSSQHCGLCPLSMGFSRQEYWSGFPCSPPGDPLNPGIKPLSPALQVDSLPLSHWESPIGGVRAKR